MSQLKVSGYPPSKCQLDRSGRSFNVPAPRHQCISPHEVRYHPSLKGPWRKIRAILWRLSPSPFRRLIWFAQADFFHLCEDASSLQSNSVFASIENIGLTALLNDTNATVNALSFSNLLLPLGKDGDPCNEEDLVAPASSVALHSAFL